MCLFQPLIRNFTKDQISFCSKLLDISPNDFESASEDDLDRLYDILCDIECGIGYEDDYKLTKEEEMATAIVTIMGKEIAKEYL